MENKANKNCKRLAIIFLGLILLFSFISQLIVTQGYKISVQHVTIEVRGADLTMDVYRPTKLTAETKLPCMIISHGGSEALSACTLHAWEYARRGFVVLCVNMYGAGTADMPDYFEDGKPYNRNQGTSGLYDALEYARSISYVDPTRIGMWGHSQAYSILGSVLVFDGELLSLNDRMFNILHDDFGLQITENQLSQNADEVAANVLSAEQMKFYSIRKGEQQKIVDNYVRACRVMDNNCCLIKTKVAGIEVVRSVNTNLQIGGERNGTTATSATRFTQPNDRYKTIYRTDGPMERNSYYLIPDVVRAPDAKSVNLGAISETSVLTNKALKEGLENRSVYITYNPPTHHNGNLWSPAAITPTMEFFTQALEYNNGELNDPSTTPISTMKLTSSYIALVFATLATFSLLGFIGALAGVLLTTKFFKPCEIAVYEPKLKIKSTDFLIASIIAVVTSFVGAYFGSRETLGLKASNAFMSKFLPTEPGHFRLYFMVLATAVCGAILFGIFIFISHKQKKDTSVASLSSLNAKISIKSLLKTGLLCIILFAAAYTLEAFLEGAFDGRFQFVDGSFELMKPYTFVRMLKYTIMLLPLTFVISALNNLTIVKGVSDAMDTAIAVLVQSLGTWIFLLIAHAITFSTPDHMTALGLHTMLPAIFLVPMCNYLYRKLFKATGSLWTGSLMVALLLGWRLASYVSHRFMFWGYTDQIARFFGF